MGIIVQKFGGSSVENTEKLFNISKHIINEYDNNNKVVVTVSAQGKTTDILTKESKEINEKINQRELDALLSIGEQITTVKLVMCLNKLGYNAISLTGWQIPIKTTNNYGNADILNINTKRIQKELEQGKIVVVAGFQGINEETNNITTLGRGGSDTTAVALAVALKADSCNIYKDVEGVYDIDPKTNKNAKKYDNIDYDEMLKLSNNGAKVLHNKCIQIAKENDLTINIKNVCTGKTGTIIKRISI